MELTDLLPLDKWAAFEMDVNKKSGLDANVFNTDGVRITDVKNWANRLCPAIKDTDKGQAFICAVAHMNLAILAKNTRKPCIEECDAGILKMVVPIFVNDEFIGAFGACGLLPTDGEVDTFMINRTTGIEEEKIESLAKGMGTISRDQAESIAAYIEKRIQRIVTEWKASR